MDGGDEKVLKFSLLERSVISVIVECSGNFSIILQYSIAAILLTKYHKQTLNHVNS